MGLSDAGDHHRRDDQKSTDDLISECVALTNRLSDALTRLGHGIARQRRQKSASFKTVHEAANAQNDRLDAVKNIIWARKRRNLHFGGNPAEPAHWDILLDLYAANLEGRNVSVSSLTIAANVPATTALRHIAILEQRGEVEKHADPLDKRRSFVRLSPNTMRLMDQWVSEFVSSEFTNGEGL